MKRRKKSWYKTELFDRVKLQCSTPTLMRTQHHHKWSVKIVTPPPKLSLLLSPVSRRIIKYCRDKFNEHVEGVLDFNKITYLKQAAHLGDPGAAFTLYKLYENQDNNKARKALNKSIRNGSKYAVQCLADAHIHASNYALVANIWGKFLTENTDKFINIAAWVRRLDKEALLGLNDAIVGRPCNSTLTEGDKKFYHIVLSQPEIKTYNGKVKHAEIKGYRGDCPICLDENALLLLLDCSCAVCNECYKKISECPYRCTRLPDDCDIMVTHELLSHDDLFGETNNAVQNIIFNH